MAKLWTICGGGRGVGKTHLALALCETLSESVYVKLGYGKRDPSKPAHLVRSEDELDAFIRNHAGASSHIVAEANSLARKGEGDVIVFIDAASDHESPREDHETLRANAHIVISADADTRNWASALRTRLGDSGLAEKALRVILQQQSYLFGSDVRVRSRVWFMAGGRRVFGSGLAGLLEGIDRLGSLSEAAKSMKISYRQAWDLIREAESGLGKRLIVPRAGGAGGGGSTLSEDGRKVLKLFKAVSRDVAEYADARFAELYK